MQTAAHRFYRLPLVALLALVSILALSYCQPVNAQELTLQAPLEITLTAIPPRLGDDGSLHLKPGEKTQIQLQVKNTSSRPVTILSTARNFIIAEDGETPVPISDTVSNRWSLASWLVIAPSTQTIAPNQTVGLTALIQVPEDALPGGHYAMLTHEPTTEPGENLVAPTDAAASAVSQKVGTLVYLTVEGPINEEAYIRSFQFRNFSEYGPVPFSYLVENQSDIHIRPQVGIDIYNIIGQKIDTISIDTKNVFPFMSRQFDGQWDRVWGWGYYRAKLTMSFGEQGSVVMANTGFWLVPIKLIIAFLIVLLTILAMGITIRNHILHRRTQNRERIDLLEKKLTEMEKDQLKRYED